MSSIPSTILFSFLFFTIKESDVSVGTHTNAKIEQATVKKTLPFHLQFAAGAIAGVSEICVMYPLDGRITRF